MKLDARLASLGQGLGTAAVLWDGERGFCFPLARVGKYLENGAGDSVHVFALGILGRPRATARSGA